MIALFLRIGTDVAGGRADPLPGRPPTVELASVGEYQSKVYRVATVVEQPTKTRIPFGAYTSAVPADV